MPVIWEEHCDLCDGPVSSINDSCAAHLNKRRLGRYTTGMPYLSPTIGTPSWSKVTSLRTTNTCTCCSCRSGNSQKTHSPYTILLLLRSNKLWSGQLITSELFGDQNETGTNFWCDINILLYWSVVTGQISKNTFSILELYFALASYLIYVFPLTMHMQCGLCTCQIQDLQCSTGL